MGDRLRPTYDFALNALGTDSGSRGVVYRAIPTGSRVLDVGCDTGRFGEALRREKGCEVHGVERDPEAARQAAERLHGVHVRAVESQQSLDGLHDFDAVLFLDVLEHLYDPWSVLRGAFAALRPGGSLYAVVPNVAHVSIVRRLLSGHFDYQEHGAMDRTHVRWFTRRSFDQALRDAGFVETSVQTIPQVPWVQEVPKVGQVLASRLNRTWPDLFGGSLVGTGRRPSAPVTTVRDQLRGSARSDREPLVAAHER